VAAIPFIYSINRGMWGACVAMALFVALRAALTGRPGVLAGVIAGASILAVILAISPLGHIVALRFSNEGSEEGRTNLGTLAVRSVTATSPIVGMGSTRNVQGNFQSITGGSTAQCPRCSKPALGTQGQVWLVVFSQGLVGLFVFMMFFALAFLRHIRLRSPVVTVALSAMVAWVVTMPVYNSLGTGMLVVMVAVGLLCREGASGAGRLPSPGDRSLTLLDRYLAALRTGALVILAMGLAGLGTGWWLLSLNPSPYKATTSLLLSEPPRYPSPGYARTNVDTDAQLVAGKLVRDATTRASGESSADVAEHLTVTATPNTRVVHLHLTAPTADAARNGVEAAADAFLGRRTVRLEADRDRELAILRASSSTLSAAIDMLNKEVRATRTREASYANELLTSVPRDHRNELLARANLAGRQSARIRGLVLAGGRRIAATEVNQSGDRPRVYLISGLTAGLGLGGMLAVLWGAAGPRLKRVKDIDGHTGLPLLARAPVTAEGVRSIVALFSDRPMACISAVETDADSAEMADRLANTMGRPRLRSGAVIVASGQTRTQQVQACERRLKMQGVPVRGVVLTTGKRPRQRG
jgi:capsular polysaccharide biosynthesis protein